MSKLSVIIPMLNEASTIGKLLEHLQTETHSLNDVEIIVVDGGSSDDSMKIANSFKNIHVIQSGKGRAKQMNVGAEAANGKVLYFLHADSIPPNSYDQLILQEVEQGNLAGCFRLKFDHDHWWLKLAGWLTRFRWRACRGGDQSQFITRELFNDIGGFDERYIIYEDNDLINKLYARKQFVVIQECIQTSARCYERHGIWKLQYHFWAIYVKKWLGATPESLHAYYKKKIA